MAVKTLGTNLTTTLKAIQFPAGYSGGAAALLAADVASIANSILTDETPRRSWVQKILAGAFGYFGLLYIPQRGVLKVLPGDWVAVDPTGWPILIGKRALPTTLTATGNTHTSTLVDGLSTNVLNIGWSAGMIISSSNADIPANTHIQTIAIDGLSLTLSAAATGSNNGGTLTAGSWTHS